MASLSIFQATIGELQNGLSLGAITSVDLVAAYLRRISTYDQGGDGLNAIPVINPAIFDEAAASDDYRAGGGLVRPLEGIPYTAKDSYKVKGLTVAAGSPAFKDLISNEDARVVELIRNAGGICLGKTNMPPMAEGGMQVGVYGRAESPYSPNYLAAAFGSGSSNGAGVSVTSSFGAFGLGEETFSSGRSPASNNALVAYTPSRGIISIRGNWPLYPTHDVVVPMTTTVDEMLTLLDVIAVGDAKTEGDFWRDQPLVDLPKANFTGKFFRDVKLPRSMDGIRVAVPLPYVGGPQFPGARPIVTSPAVVDLWKRAKKDLESLGATIVELPDLPLVTLYDNVTLRAEGTPSLPLNWQASINGTPSLFNGLMAHSWNTFLELTKDTKIPNLQAANLSDVWPFDLRAPTEQQQQLTRNNGTVPQNRYASFANITRSTTYYGQENLDIALRALEAQRKIFFEDWLDANNCSFVVFPAAGDVASADTDVNGVNFNYTNSNTVWFSTGNAVIRHLGVPTVTVNMGMLSAKAMPMGLTFAGRAYDDGNLLGWAHLYEQKSKRRQPPPLVPELKTDIFPLTEVAPSARAKRPTLKASIVNVTTVTDPSQQRVFVEGTVEVDAASNILPLVDITVGTYDVPGEHLTIQSSSNSTAQGVYTFSGWADVPKPVEPNPRFKTWTPVARDKTMVVVLARSGLSGYPAGFVELI